jgi:Protein of unknown function (DUF3060).
MRLNGKSLKNGAANVKLIFTREPVECYDDGQSANISSGFVKIMKSKFLILFLAAIFLSACGNEPSNVGNSTTNNAQANSNPSPVPTEDIGKPGDKLVLSDVSESKKINCNGREIEIDAEATANSYTFTGECKKLSVDGVSNEIRVEKVGEIIVKGTSNKVVYGEGLDGKKPKISKSGTDTMVESQKAYDERKAAEAKKAAAEKK